VRAADLGDRVVAVPHEDALVEPGGPLALLALEGAASLGDVGGELVEVEAAQTPGVAGVAGEERALDRLREIDQREDGTVEVGEVGGEEPPFLFCEFLDRVAHERSIVMPPWDGSHFTYSYSLLGRGAGCGVWAAREKGRSDGRASRGDRSRSSGR
jgi:hypothetical protein